MHTLLNQEAVAPFYLQASPDDITVVIAFDDEIMSEWIVEGNDKDDLGRLDSAVSQQQVDGNTDIYLPAARALQIMKSRGIGDRLPSIILMTDGWSNTGSIGEVESAMRATGLRVPVYGITFGDASVDQLQRLADLTSGRVFDGKKDLLAAFRKARGNN
jgi:Ca-activated chloride channel family protein